jgi:hypothetical protein
VQRRAIDIIARAGNEQITMNNGVGAATMQVQQKNAQIFLHIFLLL